jgi:hypothetical protein
MYADFPPEPNAGRVEQVLVIEDGDSENTVDEIIEEARDAGAVCEDNDGDEIFYIVFAEEPRRIWDFTERSLRRSLNRRFAASQESVAD